MKLNMISLSHCLTQMMRRQVCVSVCVCVCALPTLKYVWAGHVRRDLMLGSARFQSVLMPAVAEVILLCLLF